MNDSSQKIELTPEVRKALAATLMKGLDEHSKKIYNEGHRHHLGASVVGDDCYAKMWYSFRWVKGYEYINQKTGKDETGRMRRLLNRGHKEEERFVEWFRGMGLVVEQFTPDGKQYRIAGVNGHYGGSLDGRTKLPDWLGSYPEFLLEFKTSGSKYFEELKAKGVERAKPVHFKQMCAYGKNYQLQHAIYCSVNKDTDEVYIEVVLLNWAIADHLEKVAEHVITSQTRPARISNDASYQKCKYLCEFKKICHFAAPVEKNCRSCQHAQPAAEGKWHCNFFNDTIPKDFLPVGCDNHVGVK